MQNSTTDCYDALEIEQGDVAKKNVSFSKSRPMSKGRILKNLFILCAGFLLLFCSYQALANLQSTLNIESHVGIMSQSIIYAALILSSLFLPKLIIRKFGCKVTLVLCSILYVPYIAANFYPSMSTFIPSALVIGLAAAPLWSAKCTYLNEISVLYADQSSDTADVMTTRFFGVFFMFFQNSQIWGNLVSFYVLKPPEEDPLRDMQKNISNSSYFNTFINNSKQDVSNLTCGANFCSGINENLLPPTEEKRYMLVGIYVAVVLAASLILGLFLDPLPSKKPNGHESLLSRLAATMKQLKKPNQFFLVPITIFSGIEQAFILSDYSQAYVACAWGIYHVGLVFICFGIVDGAMSFLSGRLVKYVSRMTLMLTGAVANIAVCTTLFLWQPNSEQYVVFFVLAGVWGLADAIWQTQLNAFYGVLFRSDEEAAFSNYKLWESAGFFLAFGYSTFLCVVPKIIILLVFLVVGMFGYIIVELRNRHEKVQSKNRF